MVPITAFWNRAPLEGDFATLKTANLVRLPQFHALVDTRDYLESERYSARDVGQTATNSGNLCKNGKQKRAASVSKCIQGGWSTRKNPM